MLTAQSEVSLLYRKGDELESRSTSLALLPLDSFSKNIPLSLCPALTLVCVREATVERTLCQFRGSGNFLTVCGRGDRVEGTAAQAVSQMGET